MFLVFCLLSGGAPGVHGGEKALLFPLQAGNRWVLEASPGDRREIRCEPEGGKRLRVSGLFENGEVFYGKPLSTRLRRIDRTTGKLKRGLTLKPFTSTDSAFAVGDLLCDQLVCELRPVDNIILTRNELFFDCSALRVTAADPLSTVCRELFTEKIFFSPEVGPVQIQGSIERLYLLVWAQVGGFIYGQDEFDDVSGFLSSDRGVYTSRASTIQCRDLDPCPSDAETAVVRFTFEVFNDSFSEKRFRYRHGDQFDIVIFDAEGHQVTSWSEQSRPDTDIQHLALELGDFHEFVVDIELKDRDGNQLEGEYSVAAFLENEDGSPDAAEYTTILVEVIKPAR